MCEYVCDVWVLQCIVVYCIVIYCIVLHCIVVFCIVLHCTVWYGTVWYIRAWYACLLARLLSKSSLSRSLFTAWAPSELPSWSAALPIRIFQWLLRALSSLKKCSWVARRWKGTGGDGCNGLQAVYSAHQLKFIPVPFGIAALWQKHSCGGQPSCWALAQVCLFQVFEYFERGLDFCFNCFHRTWCFNYMLLCRVVAESSF